MMHQAGRGFAAILILSALAACQPAGVTSLSPGGPQYEAGDPCKGVVPEMCAY